MSDKEYGKGFALVCDIGHTFAEVAARAREYKSMQCASVRRVPTARGFPHYRPAVAARQPHEQSASWQRHPVFVQPQGHVPQLQAPQQLLFAVVSSGPFFELDIVFLLSGSFSASALSYGLTRFGPKTLHWRRRNDRLGA